MPLKFSSIPEAVEAIGRGEVVIVLDDEHRENEGDYICAAELATAESINLVTVSYTHLTLPTIYSV